MRTLICLCGSQWQKICWLKRKTPNASSCVGTMKTTSFPPGVNNTLQAAWVFPFESYSRIIPSLAGVDVFGFQFSNFRLCNWITNTHLKPGSHKAAPIYGSWLMPFPAIPSRVMVTIEQQGYGHVTWLERLCQVDAVNCRGMWLLLPQGCIDITVFAFQGLRALLLFHL